MFSIEINIPDKELAKIDMKSKEVRRGLVKGVRQAMFMAEAHAKKNFGGSGQLQVQTGHLRRSIFSTVKDQGREIIGTVSSNTIYSAIHEFGGLHPRSKHIKMPKRPFITPAFEDKHLKEYQSEIVKNVLRETK